LKSNLWFFFDSNNIFKFFFINDNKNNKNKTNDYKLGSGAPARPKFLGSGSPNNNKNNNINNNIKLL
jgi:hypothetical protein